MGLRPTWLHIPVTCLSGSWRSFLYSSSFVYYCHLFLISPASVRSLQFLSFIEPNLCIKCSLGISNFLEGISSLSLCIVFISVRGLLRKAFLSFLAVLWNSAFKWVYIFPFLLCFLLRFFSQLFVRPPQTVILLFCISFSWAWSWFLSPVQCHKHPSIFHHKKLY